MSAMNTRTSNTSGVFADIGEENEGLGVLQRHRMGACDLREDRVHPPGVDAVGDVDRDVDAAELVAMRPVADRAVDQFASWAG